MVILIPEKWIKAIIRNVPTIHVLIVSVTWETNINLTLVHIKYYTSTQKKIEMEISQNLLLLLTIYAAPSDANNHFFLSVNDHVNHFKLTTATNN